MERVPTGWSKVEVNELVIINYAAEKRLTVSYFGCWEVKFVSTACIRLLYISKPLSVRV